MKKKEIIVIAGPNGAGKTTFARQYIPQKEGNSIFINADLIASGLSPFNPEMEAIRAGRIMLEEIKKHLRNSESFSLESTLSGKGYITAIQQWRNAGYEVHLVYLSLPNAEVAVRRVKARILQGGHSIPEDVIHRRFAKSIYNFENYYKTIVDSWALYDNGGDVPVLVDEG